MRSGWARSICWHGCPDCGTSLHWDHNAAKNIEWVGRALRERLRRQPCREPRISKRESVNHITLPHEMRKSAAQAFERS